MGPDGTRLEQNADSTSNRRDVEISMSIFRHPITNNVEKVTLFDADFFYEFQRFWKSNRCRYCHSGCLPSSLLTRVTVFARKYVSALIWSPWTMVALPCISISVNKLVQEI